MPPDSQSRQSTVAELRGFRCRVCEHDYEVWTSTHNRDVGMNCCGKPAQRMWMEYPKNILAAQLERLQAGLPPLLSRGEAMDILRPEDGPDAF